MALVRKYILSRSEGGKAVLVIERLGKKIRRDLATWCVLFVMHPPDPKEHALCSGAGIWKPCPDYCKCMDAILRKRLILLLSKKKKKRNRRRRRARTKNASKNNTISK